MLYGFFDKGRPRGVYTTLHFPESNTSSHAHALVGRAIEDRGLARALLARALFAALLALLSVVAIPSLAHAFLAAAAHIDYDAAEHHANDDQKDAKKILKLVVGAARINGGVAAGHPRRQWRRSGWVEVLVVDLVEEVAVVLRAIERG